MTDSNFSIIQNDSFNKHQFQELSLEGFSEYEKCMKRETKIFPKKVEKIQLELINKNRILNRKF